MDFDLTDEQRAIQETVREFVDRRVLPVAQENDINHHLDMGIIEGMAELGLLGPVIPTEYGGSGLDYVSEALICEEIERGESAFRTLISVHVGLNSLSLLKFGTEEQKQKYLVPMAKGEKLGCFGLTEPAAGSDVAAMLTTAIPQPDGTYVLNGQKSWISYATEADYALVFAKHDPDGGHRGISAFMVETGWEGIEARRIPNKLGDLGRLDGRAVLHERPGAGREPDRRAGRGIQDRHALARPGPVHRRGGRRRRRPGMPGGVGQVRQRAPYVRPGDRQVPVRAGHDRRHGAGLRDVEAAGDEGCVDEEHGRAQHEARRRWPSGTQPRARSTRPTRRSRCTGRTATPPSTRWSATSATRARPIIYEGTTQIHKMMQAEHALGYRKLNG